MKTIQHIVNLVAMNLILIAGGIFISLWCQGAFADVPTLAAAAVSVTPPAGFEWLVPVLAFLQSIPGAGPVVVTVLHVLGVAATLFTLISVFFTGAAKAVESLSFALGFVGFAASVKAFYDKVYPWVAYFSVFNVPRAVK